MAILLTSTVGPAAWYLVPPAKYKAQARLQLAAQPPKVLFRTVETDMVDDYKRYQTTQQTLVLSQLVLNTALKTRKSAPIALSVSSSIRSRGSRKISKSSSSPTQK